MKINKSSVLYSGIILTFSNIALQILGFIYRIFLSEFAGAEGLGVYKIVLSAFTIINAVCLSGIIMALSKISSDLSVSGFRGKIISLRNMSVKIFIVLFSVCAITVVFFRGFIAEHILHDTRTEMALLMMLGCLFLLGFENIHKSIFIGIQKVKYVGISECSEQIIRMVVVCILLYNFAHLGLDVVAFMIMLGMTISEVFSSFYLTFQFQKEFFKVKKLSLSREIYKKFGAIALPVAFSALVSNILSSADSIVLPLRLMEAGLTKSEALSQLGIISGMALPLIILPIAIIGSISTVLLPNASKSMAIGDTNRLGLRISKAIRITGLIGVPATMAIIPLSVPLARLFFKEDIPYNYMLMLGIAVIFLYYQIITASALNGMGKQKLTMTSIIIGELLQLIIFYNLAAIPRFNIYGYIIAIIAAPIVGTALNFYNIRKCVKLPISVRKIFFEPFFCGICVFAWVTYIYNLLLGTIGSQIEAVFLASVSAFVVYLIVLKITGVKIKNYIGTLIPQNLGMFSFYGFM